VREREGGSEAVARPTNSRVSGIWQRRPGDAKFIPSHAPAGTIAPGRGAHDCRCLGEPSRRKPARHRRGALSHLGRRLPAGRPGLGGPGDRARDALTWWLEAIRRALDPANPSSIGGPGSLFQSLTGQVAPGNAEVLIALLVTGAVVTLAAAGVFRLSSRRAKEQGLLDRTTGS
jgi:hypothetical protein